eukprot:gene24723-29875_t
MITAFAYALRTNRTFLLQGDPALEKLFRPFEFSPILDADKSWGSWDWADWHREYSWNMSKLTCVNPKPGNTHCALDSLHHDANRFKVIKYYGNRSYICRWMKILQNEEEKHNLLSSLGIDKDANLYEVAGCLLRLVMYPSEKLWQAVDSFIADTLVPGGNLRFSRHQVGVHFRCGDSSFDPNNKDKPPNPECYYSPAVPWHGTNFGDDQTMDSPLDLAHCANKSLLHVQRHDAAYAINVNQSAVFVASDNRDSARQMMQNLDSSTIIYPREACHIDNAGGHHDCSEDTLVQWFTLGQSDIIVTQETLMQDGGPYTDIATPQEVAARSHAPISAFSRFAVIYGLTSHNLRYGNCKPVDPLSLSHYSHGNWVCTPRMFY